MSSWTRTKHLHAVRSKCEHAVAIRMLAFRSDYVHFLRSAKPIFHIWTSRSPSRPLAIFKSLLHATVKYLEISNVRIAILKIAVQLYCNTPGNPRMDTVRLSPNLRWMTEEMILDHRVTPGASEHFSCMGPCHGHAGKMGFGRSDNRSGCWSFLHSASCPFLLSDWPLVPNHNRDF